MEEAKQWCDAGSVSPTGTAFVVWRAGAERCRYLFFLSDLLVACGICRVATTFVPRGVLVCVCVCVFGNSMGNVSQESKIVSVSALSGGSKEWRSSMYISVIVMRACDMEKELCSSPTWSLVGES